MKSSPNTAVYASLRFIPGAKVYATFIVLLCVSTCMSALWAQIPAQSESNTPSRTSRRNVTLAQIPTVPTAPGANPNAAPPSFPKLPSTSAAAANNNQLPRAKPPRGGFGRAGSPSPAGGAIPSSPTPVPSQLPTAKPAPSGTPKVPSNSALQPPPPPPSASADDPVATTSDDGSEPMIGVQFPQAPLPDILLWYEEQTGKKIVRDINVEQVTISIDTTGQMPKSKAIEYVERSLLLNGYAFVPVDDITVKFINVGAIKPSAEMTPDNIFTDVSKLPKDERIVTFIQPLQFIDAEDLRKSLTELIPQAHPYNIISPLPNSRGVVITENSNTIRYMLELLTHLDVEPSRTDQRSFQLERSDAEEVAKALSDILDLEGKGKSSSGSGSKTGYTPPTQPNAGQPGQAGIPNQPSAAHAATPTVYGAAPQATAIPPKIIPIKRKNSLLVIARPIDLTMIEKLIEELDSAAVIRTFTNRKLVYLHALDVLPIIQDAITRGLDEGSGGSGGPGTSQPGNLTSPSTTNTSNNSNRNSPFGGNNSSYGSGGMGGGGSGGFGSSFGSGSGSGGIASLREKSTPKSMVVGKTFLIADPVANVIFASGPPEQLRVLNELFDEIDKRPQSVEINVVIGQLTLGDKRDVGIDYLFRPTQVKFGSQTGTFAGTAGSRVGANNTFTDASSVSGIKDLLGTSGIGQGLSLFGTLSDQVSVAISALSTNTDFKLLSRPILYTLNNMPAVIENGIKIPIPTPGYGGYGGYNGVSDGSTNTGNINNQGYSSGGVSYQDVNLSLEVTPHINGEDELTLEVKQQNANQNGSTTVNGNKISNISQQRLDTTVMVKNLSTVILGGLIQENVEKEKGGIPILRHIPIIKYLAGSSKNYKDRNELLIFIQPRIISGEGDLPPAYMDSAGSTTLAADARRFLNQEKSDPDPDKQVIHRSKIGSLIHKLFQ